jgi:hypothetical protein
MKKLDLRMAIFQIPLLLDEGEVGKVSKLLTLLLGGGRLKSSEPYLPITAGSTLRLSYQNSIQFELRNVVACNT